MDTRFVLGIDPGVSGGLALVGESFAEAIKMPETERDAWDLIREWAGQSQLAIIENVHSMPGQGVSSTFKFGQNLGMLRGMLIAAGVPFEAVTPQAWQKAMGCLSRGDKNVTKARAQQLFPALKITHATADALLLAEYGRRLAVSPAGSVVNPMLYDPLKAWPEFMESARKRLDLGRLAYGDESFQRPGAELAREIEDELLDVANWSFILWSRVRAMRERLERLQ